MADEKEQGYEWLEDMKSFNKELDARILEANQDDTKLKWSKLLPDLMAAEVLMIGQYTEESVNGEKHLNILMMQREGKIAVPFFTSPERISVFVKQNQTQFDVMKINTVNFFRSVMGKVTVMNPLTPYSRVFSPFEMTILVEENKDKAPDPEK
ncbi:MAG: SseB family protein [Oscillospiraceae bacterium]|nr:SseB family protein [Oscillospiraceae bacterium]